MFPLEEESHWLFDVVSMEMKMMNSVLCFCHDKNVDERADSPIIPADSEQSL
jgi:hypothetical protein